jgi:hypothetical protein
MVDGLSEENKKLFEEKEAEKKKAAECKLRDHNLTSFSFAFQMLLVHVY